MDTDDVLKDIQESLKKLERLVERSVDASSASGRKEPRPTEQFPKIERIELEIKKAIEAHVKDCAAAMKERLVEKIEPLAKKIEKVEGKLEEMRKEIGARINGVKDDAAKSATNEVVSVRDRLNAYGNDIQEIKEGLNGTETEPGVYEMVRDFGQWVEVEEERRKVESERSKFRISTLLEITGIIVAISLGLAGLFLK